MKQCCLIYANCQGTGIEEALRLSPEFTRHFTFHVVSNWSEASLPETLLEQCALFLYQPTKARAGIASTEDLRAHLPETARAMSFPYMYFKALWPFHQRSSCNDVGKDFPRERHYYADTILDKLSLTALPLSKAAQIYLDLDFVREYSITDSLAETLQLQKNKEQPLDIKSHDFIETLYTRQPLFYTVRHPTPFLYWLVANRILAGLGLPRVKQSELGRMRPVYAIPYEHPVHPEIARVLRLSFIDDTTQYNLWGDFFTYQAYLYDYIAHRRKLTAWMDATKRQGWPQAQETTT